MSSYLDNKLAEIPVVKQFVGEFDTEAYLRNVLRQGSIPEELKQLSNASTVVDGLIRELVTEHHSELIKLTTHMQTLDDSVTQVTQKITRLQSNIDSVKTSIREPYTMLRSRTNQLMRLQSAADILRRIIRCRDLFQKLRRQMNSVPRDLAKAASCVHDLQATAGDMQGVEEMEGQLETIPIVVEQITREGLAQLQTAVQKRAQVEIGSALQIFFNLKTLHTVVKNELNRLVAQVGACLSTALDPSQLPSADDLKKMTIGASSSHKISSSSAFRSALNSRLEAAIDDILLVALRAWVLVRVLGRKRDPASHTRFIDVVHDSAGNPAKNESVVYGIFWSGLCSAFSKQFTAAGYEALIKQTLEGDIVSVRRVLSKLYTGLVEQAEAGVSSILRPQHLDQLLASLQEYQSAFLNKSYSRTAEAVNNLFVRGMAAPDARDVNAVVKRIRSDMLSVVSDGNLAAQMAKRMSGLVSLVLVTGENWIDAERGPDGRHKEGVVTRAMAAFSAHAKLAAGLRQIEHELPPGVARTTLAESGLEIAKHAQLALDPVLERALEKFRAAFLSMHLENYSSDVSGEESVFTTRVKDEVNLFREQVLAKLEPHDTLQRMSAHLVAVCLRLFVRNVVLVRPLGDTGKMRLASDAAQLEMLLNLLSPVERAGRDYVEFKAILRVLFVDGNEEALANELEDMHRKKQLPPSVLLHAAIQHAPPEIFFVADAVPGRARAAAMAAYNRAIDEAGPGKDELLVQDRIGEALDDYARGVHANQRTSYAPIYPVLRRLLVSLTK